MPFPCFKPFFHYPEYFQAPLKQLITPKPFLLSFLQFPQYFLPSGHSYTPFPSFKPFCQLPTQRQHAFPQQMHYPSILPLRKSPSKMPQSPICMPLPCLLPLRKSPTYLLPSVQLASPVPLGMLFFHWPSYLQPLASWQRPCPSAQLPLISPSQQLPSALTILPCPWHLPPTKVPSRQSPLSKYSFPNPTYLLSSISPTNLALRNQSYCSSWARGSEAEITGRLFRVDSTVRLRLESLRLWRLYLMMLSAMLGGDQLRESIIILFMGVCQNYSEGYCCFYQFYAFWTFCWLWVSPMPLLIIFNLYLKQHRLWRLKQQQIQIDNKEQREMELQDDMGGYRPIGSGSNHQYQTLPEGQNYMAQSSSYNSAGKGEDTLAHLDQGLAGAARKGFIMKVYIILSLQLLITASMCFVSYFVESFLQFQIDNQWLMWVAFSFLLVTEIAIFCCPAGRKHPINLILLLVFTLCESYTVSYICSMVAEENGSGVVVVAAVMTLAIVVALSAYAIFTKEDFTTKWGIIIVLLVAMLMLGIFSIFMWSPFLDNLYCTLGVIVFGIYIVIDTQLIIGGRKIELSMDDYVVGALILYIDIITLFLYLLQLLSKKR